jgi:hypothetical protein
MRVVIETGKDESNIVEDDLIRICVKDVGNADYEFLSAVRLFVEAYLKLKDAVDPTAVARFSEHFDDMKLAFPDLVGQMEAGDHDNAPHNKQHKIALMMERWLSDNMQIDYEQYQKTIYS